MRQRQAAHGVEEYNEDYGYIRCQVRADIGRHEDFSLLSER
jgi:hypothetical protein